MTPEWWEAVAPLVAVVCLILAAWVTIGLFAVVRGLTKRVPMRCWFGHRWTNHGGRWSPDWRCDRCPTVPPACSNCGGQHNPNAFTVCSVTRSR